MQAVAFADDDAQAAMRDRLAKGSGELSEVGGPAELGEALKAARAANNGPISIDEARAAAEIAAPLRAAGVKRRRRSARPRKRRGAGADVVAAP